MNANSTTTYPALTPTGLDLIRLRFSARKCLRKISINSEPVNHTPFEEGLIVEYRPLPGELHYHALERFFGAIEAASAASMRAPTVFRVRDVDNGCSDEVIIWLRVVLGRGVETILPQYRRIVANPENLVVDLWLAETDQDRMQKAVEYLLR